MRTQSLFFLITTTLLLHLTATHSLIDTTAYSPTAAPTTAPTEKDMEFIRKSCESTQYPQVCYDSLSHYASAIHQDPAPLARVAIAVSLSKAKHEAHYFSKVSKKADNGVDNSAAAALRDCSSVFEDAVDQLQDSLNQMRLVVEGSGWTFRSQISNVQTWMSAALTNEGTCTDGFDGVSEGPLKTGAFDRVGRVEAVTSNALALVNSYAAWA